MATAAGKKKATKKRKGRSALRREADSKRVHWEEEPWAFDPDVVYAYHRRGGQPMPIGEAAHLPELVGLLVKAVQYFEIDGRPDAPKRTLPTRVALRTFFANQRLSDGGRLSTHQMDAMVNFCLPSRGGRPRKGQPSSLDAFNELHEDMNARERERVLLRMISGSPQSDGQTDPDDAPDEPENR
jgi:hypothetical protein